MNRPNSQVSSFSSDSTSVASAEPEKKARQAGGTGKPRYARSTSCLQHFAIALRLAAAFRNHGPIQDQVLDLPPMRVAKGSTASRNFVKLNIIQFHVLSF